MLAVFNSTSDGASNSKGLQQFQEIASRFYHLTLNSKLKRSWDPVSRVAGAVFHVLSGPGLGVHSPPSQHSFLGQKVISHRRLQQTLGCQKVAPCDLGSQG